MIIKLDPQALEQTGPVSVTLPQLEKSSDLVKPTPAAEMAREFNVEQLPTLDDGDSFQPDVEPTPPAAKTKSSDVKALVVDKAKAEIKPEATTKEPEGLSKFLKAPGAAKGEAKPVLAGGIKPVTVPQKTTDDFDYAPFGEEASGHFKKMAKETRTWTANIIKERDELRKVKDSTYLQHEEAYKLDPAYNDLQRTVNFNWREAQHWNQQLELAKMGKPIRELKDFDNNGNPVLGPEIPSNSQIEEQLRLAVQKAVGATESNSAKLREYPQKYKSAVTNDLRNIESFMKSKFEWENKPELLDYSIAVDDGNGGTVDKPIKDIRKEIIDMLPPYMRSHPTARLCANMGVGLILNNSQIRELSSNQQLSQAKSAEASRVEPTSGARGLPESEQLVFGDKKVPKNFTMDGFNPED